MKYSFYLRKSKSESETLVMFSCYFNEEKKEIRLFYPKINSSQALEF
ncbi:Integrase [Croceitalea dokdonensis DOKDO 023]|uniref:Integrase n=1 Tax=Croceitalea dokdonensis DOKDO 023 TaxID=1300341 RepID=A0A0P7AT01_9FLAO|nr:Integrase [Croceitalea dokdonensis DOKDO 023]